MIKTIQIVPSINAEASGPSYSVTRLCEAISAQDEDVDLHVLEPVSEILLKTYKIHAHPVWPLGARLGISPHMQKALAESAKTSQIMHNHSLWMMPNIYPLKAVKNTKCRLVISPRGTLSEYALNRSKWLKKAVWALGQGNTLKKAACLHATAETEFYDIRQKGLNAPVAIIPNGIDIPQRQERSRPDNRRKKLLFLSRIDHKKGIDILLNAWSDVEKFYLDWELHIVGPDNRGYLLQMQALAKDLNIKRVFFPGPVYGDEKGREYFSADLYVLPTYSENFGITVAEALAHGVPAIVTKGAPWSGLETNNCGWWINIGKDHLVEALHQAMSKTDDDLSEMGENGRNWMKQGFSWDRIGEMMHKTYEWILGGGTPPEWVRLDG